jgi:uncharacterized damage-inducible protein DinB
MEMSERYRRWWEYERDSHARVLASLQATAAHVTSQAEFQRAVDLLGHIVAARGLWLNRFGAADRPPNLSPHAVRLEDLPSRLHEMHDAWSVYLASLTDAELARAVEYRSLDGRRFRTSVEDILTQLHGHSRYHCGQIALLVRAAGGEPAATDFVFWARDEVPQGAPD